MREWRTELRRWRTFGKQPRIVLDITHDVRPGTRDLWWDTMDSLKVKAVKYEMGPGKELNVSVREPEVLDEVMRIITEGLVDVLILSSIDSDWEPAEAELVHVLAMAETVEVRGGGVLLDRRCHVLGRLPPTNGK